MDLMIERRGNDKRALLLLHGRGATADDLLPLVDEFGFSGLVIALQAPDREWFPESFVTDSEANNTAVQKAFARIQEVMEAQRISSENLIIAGFSQGAILVSEFIAQHTDKYGGALIFSGGLMGSEPKVKGDLKKTRVFIGCSEKDPFIPLERVEKTAKLLIEAGADVLVHTYPQPSHTITPEEISAGRTLLHEE